MRISSLQTFNNAVDQMQRGQTNLALTQQRIASGKELLRPSDDPVAAAQILKLNREVARIEKFEENIEVTDRRLRLEELTLDQINTASDRIKELTIQAGSVILTNADRGFIADEVRQLQDQILSLMNTKDAAGEYLFAGSKGFTTPFVKNSDGTFGYQGDDGQRFIQVGPELQIASSDSGRDIFQVIPDDIGVRALGSAADLATIVTDSLVVEDGEVFEAFSEQYGDVTLQVTNTGPGAYTYTLVDGAGAAVLDAGGAPIAGAGTTGTPLTFGGLSIDVTGADATITLRAEQGRHSILQTAEDLINALETPLDTPDAREAYGEALAKAHEELNIAKEGNLKVRTQLGARMNSVEAAAEANADFKLFTETALSQLEDLDYASAIAEFSFQETALQASQATFSRVSQLSLFNFL